MTGRSTVIYSSSLAIILMAIASWLSSYAESPQTADFSELQVISEQIQALSAESSSQADLGLNTLMAWWYPGEPACNAVTEAETFQFDVLKPEYFAVRSSGELELMTETRYGCNGYSKEQIELVKRLSDEQFVMVSSSYAKDMSAFLLHDEIDNIHTKQLVNFVVENDFTGLELDFEDYGGWTPEIYNQYKAFVTRLGNALQATGKQLIIDLPPVRNLVEEQWYIFRLAEIEQLPVDYILVMGYDYQFDHGVGQPVAPLDWLDEVVKFTKNRIVNDEKIIIGVPSYGYIGDKRTGKINILTRIQAQQQSLYNSAVRDDNSQELIAESNTHFLVYQDQTSLEAKLDILEKNAVRKASVWHLGGNPLPKVKN